ncbi:MAG: AbrB/MazE/SpoVT family DNA-binding domain-containing protein [Patescibacteria group bacterium]|jgi:antitoxin component of MazEF toxin-antitoxin module|nr:AbrB/MazE/SpoVT family DNA-binding domain-containing protein [Patescibacteria group bacterium]
MEITRSLQKWGNGRGVRIPQKVVQATGISINQPLAISIQGTSIVLTPIINDNELTLESMLKGVTPSLVSGELNWGEDIGAEKYE